MMIFNKKQDYTDILQVIISVCTKKGSKGRQAG